MILTPFEQRGGMRRSVSKPDDCHRSVPESIRKQPNYFLFADASGQERHVG